MSHPSPMDLILRKRLAINIYKKQSLATILKKKIGRVDSITSSGVMYEIVSNVPKASEELEDRESLAQLAASGEVARRSLDSTVTRPNYLNLNANAGLGRLNQSSPSPASSRLVSRMTTLHEENPSSNNPLISSLVYVDKLETTPEVMEDKVRQK